MSRSEEYTSLSLDKAETQTEKKERETNMNQADGEGDQNALLHCEHKPRNARPHCEHQPLNSRPDCEQPLNAQPDYEQPLNARPHCEHQPLNVRPHCEHQQLNARPHCEHQPLNARPHCEHQLAAIGKSSGKDDANRCTTRLTHTSPMRNDYGSLDAVTVCQSCQHLYVGASEVVLSPSHLQADSLTPKRVSPASHNGVSMQRPWAAYRYVGLCNCGASVSGSTCVCPERSTGSTLHGLVPQSSSFLKKVKVVALVLAALIPWAFLVAYFVLSSK